MARKKLRLRKEDVMCDLKLHWDCYISVARIRLVKTENASHAQTSQTCDNIMTCVDIL
jgi:hypothetical protein